MVSFGATAYCILLHREVILAAAAVPGRLQVVSLRLWKHSTDYLAARHFLSHGVRRGRILAAYLIRIIIIFHVLGKWWLCPFFLAATLGWTRCVRGIRLVQVAHRDILVQIVLFLYFERIWWFRACARALFLFFYATRRRRGQSPLLLALIRAFLGHAGGGVPSRRMLPTGF